MLGDEGDYLLVDNEGDFEGVFLGIADGVFEGDALGIFDGNTLGDAMATCCVMTKDTLKETSGASRW